MTCLVPMMLMRLAAMAGSSVRRSEIPVDSSPNDSPDVNSVPIVESLMIIRVFITIFCAVVASRAADAQSVAWKPARNVEIVVGVGPGGGIDRTARIVQKILQEQRLLDVTATVVNKPGGGSTIAQAYLNQRI